MERTRVASRRQRGVSLIEAGVTTAIAAVTVATAAPGWQRFVEKQRLQSAAAQLASELQFARHEAILRNAPLRLATGSDGSGSCYVIHTGSPGQCDCASQGPARCDGEARALHTVQLPGSDGVALMANVRSLSFDPLHGTISPAATFTLMTASGRALQQVVNVMGRVRTCSPQGSVPGHPVC